MSDFDNRLSDYVEVPERIRLFIEAHPEGSLQRVDWYLETLGEQQFIVYTAKALRTPDDKAPGIGTAWEPFPGQTPYTKDSELMNAETSAWGRALAALGFVSKKVASAEEVKARQADRESDGTNGRQTPPASADTSASQSRRSDGPLASEKQQGMLYAVAMQHNNSEKKAQDAIRNACQAVGADGDSRKLPKNLVDTVKAILDGTMQVDKPSDIPVDDADLLPAGAQPDPDPDESMPF